MELEAINNNINYGHIYIIQIMNLIYIGSGGHDNNKNRLETHLSELFYKIKKGEPLTRKLFKAITDFLKLLMKAIKQNPNLSFTTIKDNVKYTTLKELRTEERLNIDEYSSLNSQNGLNCVRAYRYPALTYD